MRYAKIGSISHGTLLPEDLIGTFTAEIESLILLNGTRDPSNDWTEQAREAMEQANEDHYDEDGNYVAGEDPEQEQWTLEALFDALETFAPPYCYFGANEGDGSDFGFWPCWDSLEELPKFSDLSEVPEDCAECLVVNDHGNVSLYARTGLEEVWGIV